MHFRLLEALLAAFVCIKDGSHCSCLPLATDVHVVWYSLSSMKKQQPRCVGVCIDFPQQNRFFGCCCRLRRQNKSPLCGEVMMVLQRQLCCCYTAATWWHRLGLRTACSAKRAPFLLQESESQSCPSDADVLV